VDVLGRIILTESHVSKVGDNQIQINLEGIAKGVYVIIIQKSETSMQQRIIVE
jgi:hypothetical protein